MHWVRTLLAAVISPVLAAIPMLALALAAYAAQSALYIDFVTSAFSYLLIAWPTMLIIGLPLHGILRRLGGGEAAYVIAGTLVAGGLLWLHLQVQRMPDIIGHDFATPSWDYASLFGVCMQGGLTGWAFCRRIRLDQWRARWP